MSIIEVSNITKDYGNKKGVFDVTFSVNKGEILGFLGLVPLGTSEILKVCGISLVSILWYEVVKLFKK